jgi:hypothetical protein
MTQDFFAPNGITTLSLIHQLEYNDLQTEAEKAEYAYNLGLSEAAKLIDTALTVELPEENLIEGDDVDL